MNVKRFMEQTGLRNNYLNGYEISKLFKDTRIRMGESLAVKDPTEATAFKIENWYKAVNVSLTTPHKTERVHIIGSDKQIIWITHKLEEALILIGSMIENDITTWENLPHSTKISCSCSGVTGFDYPVFKEKR